MKMTKFNWIWITISLCVLYVSQVSAEEGRCVWYGECGRSPTGVENCAYNGTAKPLYDDYGLKTLQKFCPQLYTGNGSMTCCDQKQLYTMDSNMALPQQFFKRCPSCFYNFLNIYCYLTCHPRQSESMGVDEYTQNYTVVKSVNYIMSDDFAYGMYNSCKNVNMPSANELALDIFCGRKAKDCTPKNWLTYMGDPSNGHTPFKINFELQNTPWSKHNITYLPMNETITPCNKGYGNFSACSCQDCKESCAPIPPIPPKPKPSTIIGIDTWYFVMGGVYLIFVVIFGSYVMYTNIVTRNAFGIQDSDNKQVESSDEFFAVNTNGVHKGKKKRKSKGGSKTSSLPMVNASDISFLEKIGEKMETSLQKIFQAWGTWCAKHPVIILVLGLVVAGALCAGIPLLKIVTDPVKLWSSEDSTARRQKDYFDSHFGPFYRTEQLIVTRPNNKTNVLHPLPPPSTESENFTNLFDNQFLHDLLDLQLAIENITAQHENKTVHLEDICFQPLAPDNQKCTIQSVLEYWQESHDLLDVIAWETKWHFQQKANYLDHLAYCTSAPASTQDTTGLNQSCLSTGGQPIFPWIILGGYDGEDYKTSTAFVITFVNNNHLDDKLNGPAKAWEKEFINFMKSYKNPNMTIAYSSERSIEDEIERESNSDVLTILISYLIMFAYIALTLGQIKDFSRPDYMIIDSKITLGLGGVLIVLLSVGASIGVFSYLGTAATLIIIEVVPFLCLAVGVDNIFILVQTFQRDVRSPTESLEDQIGRVLGKVGPSMLLTSLAESVAFFLGALTDMPAVKVFSLYAGMAVFIDFLLQITCFVGLMTLDARRQEGKRFDMCCCVRSNDRQEKQEKSEGFLFKCVKNYYAPWLLKEWVRPIVMLVFTAWLCVSVALIHKVDIGLDQKLSMPDDSYVLDYFGNLSQYLHVGAPVYYVVEEGHDYTSALGQNEVCGAEGCLQDSLVGQLFTASQRPNYSRIAQPVSSWLDDYFSWLTPGGHPQCCRENITSHTLCPSTVPDNATECHNCVVHENEGRPDKKDFMKYLPWFLDDVPGTICAKGGHAAYGSAVNVAKNQNKVGATYFMTYHTILKTSADYIDALKQARRIADNITTAMEPHGQYKIFPYSIFYVFYEQYLTVVHDTIFNLCLCIAAIFVVTFVLLGFDLVSAIMVLISITMILVDILAYMYLWDISLNAISVVNLVMAIGISVEFCAHIIRAFAVSLQPTRVERALDALAHMGSSVLSGITLTKLGGIIVLAFSKSQLFQVFYFRMYLAMVIFGATHGLIFLPVLLSYVGPSLNKAKLYRKQVKATYSGSVDTHDRANLVDNEIHSEPPPSYNSVS